MKPKQILFIILAILAGEIALILLTTIAQEVIFSGVTYDKSLFVIIVGGLLTWLAAMGAGIIARIVGQGVYKIIPIFISLIIATETTYLIMAEIVQGPLWFDILAGIALISGIWAGYYYRYFFNYLSPKTYSL